MIDVEAILEQFGGEKDVLLSGVEAFLESCPHLLGSVRTAIAREDHHALQIGAHGLKGAVVTFASGRVVEIVREIEFAGRHATDFAVIHELFAELENALDELCLDLENLIRAL